MSPDDFAVVAKISNEPTFRPVSTFDALDLKATASSSSVDPVSREVAQEDILAAALKVAGAYEERGDLTAASATLAAARKPQAGARDYRVQSRYGLNCLSMVDTLNDRGALGKLRMSVHPSTGMPRVEAERLRCYEGVFAGYGSYLSLVNDPEIRAIYLAKNGEETLRKVTAGVSAGIVHAFAESGKLINRHHQGVGSRRRRVLANAHRAWTPVHVRRSPRRYHRRRSRGRYDHALDRRTRRGIGGAA